MVNITYHRFFMHRYIYLFFLLLLPYILHPLITAGAVGMILLDISLSLVLLASMLAVSERLHIAIPSVMLMLVALVLTWVSSVVPELQVRIAAMATVCIVLIYTAIYVSRNILRRHDVTTNTIFGSLCIYLMIGYIWAFAYSILEVLHPGSFSIGPLVQLPDFDRQHIFIQMYYFMYYSFMSLTTLGLGEILPATSSARVLTVLEAIVGQVYLVVMVSRLVGLHITQTPAVTKK